MHGCLPIIFFLIYLVCFIAAFLCLLITFVRHNYGGTASFVILMMGLLIALLSNLYAIRNDFDLAVFWLKELANNVR